jgi:erythromycin esterase
MESGLVEALPVNDWVNGGPGDLTRLLRRGFTYRMGACEEIRDQLLWMRERNAVAPVDLFGIDALDGLISPLSGLALLSDVLEPADPALARLLPQIDALVGRFATDTHADSMAAYRELEPEQRDRLSVLVADLETALAERAPDHRCARDLETARWAARLVHQLDVIFRSWAPAADPEHRLNRNVRDLFMADNLEQVHRELGPGARVVVLAHNGHIARQPLVVDRGAPRTMLGQYLADRYGEAYLPVGFTCRTGTLPGDLDLGAPRVGSLDHLMARRPGPFVTDLRRWPTSGPLAEALATTGSMRLNETYCELAPAAAFDLVLHVDSVSPYQQVEEAAA